VGPSPKYTAMFINNNNNNNNNNNLEVYLAAKAL
jgi:hypothetical protein